MRSKTIKHPHRSRIGFFTEILGWLFSIVLFSIIGKLGFAQGADEQKTTLLLVDIGLIVVCIACCILTWLDRRHETSQREIVSL